MSELDTIHYLAERYLADLQGIADAIEDSKRPAPPPNVYLLRMTTPRWFAGFRGDTNRPVWSYDVKYAKTVAHSDHLAFLDALARVGETIFGMWA